MDKFSFKQFSISQDRCAMKVGTDGVLLGAWAQGGMKILDIGTGTGLVALMMAQRYPEAHVVAIDIEENAVGQAHENVIASPFADRVEVLRASAQSFRGGSFDAIVCNPPYFNNSLKSIDKQRTLARHSDTLSAADLFDAVDRLLSADGIVSIVIPTDSVAKFEAEAASKGLVIVRQYLIKTSEKRQAKRCLMAFGRSRKGIVDYATVSLTEGSKRSAWYENLTRDFYLHIPRE